MRWSPPGSTQKKTRGLITTKNAYAGNGKCLIELCGVGTVSWRKRYTHSVELYSNARRSAIASCLTRSPCWARLLTGYAFSDNRPHRPRSAPTEQVAHKVGTFKMLRKRLNGTNFTWHHLRAKLKRNLHFTILRNLARPKHSPKKTEFHCQKRNKRFPVEVHPQYTACTFSR